MDGWMDGREIDRCVRREGGMDTKWGAINGPIWESLPPPLSCHQLLVLCTKVSALRFVSRMTRLPLLTPMLAKQP